jgi:hypothetical protein
MIDGQSFTATVMQAAKFGRKEDPATTCRSLLIQCKMRSIFVIVTEVFIQQAFQMPFIHHDHVVKEIPAAVANPTLGDTILPWTSKTGPLWLDAKAFTTWPLELWL